VAEPRAVLGAAELATGEFQRQESRFRDWVGPRPDGGDGGEGPYPPEPGRYHLYLSLACPWCHRTAIVRELAGLQDAVGVSYLAPFRDERGWEFSGERFSVGGGEGPEGWEGAYRDALGSFHFMSEAYSASDPGYEGRVSVPVLWDTRAGQIVNNESSDILRMMGSADSLGGLAHGAELGLYPPPPLRSEIDALNERVYETVNNGVYRAGFSRLQGSYERAFAALFESLAWLEALLGERRYLAGERITEADWRLWVTLLRFDEVYNLHFRCNRRRIVDYPNLWAYARELYQVPGVKRTVAMDQIKRHYYTTHDELNPKRIIPVGPGYDWEEPHGRG
jgi:putative glutathione S-transferase